MNLDVVIRFLVANFKNTVSLIQKFSEIREIIDKLRHRAIIR